MSSDGYPRTKRISRNEAAQIEADQELVRQTELAIHRYFYQWERALVERASERVYSVKRALPPELRVKLEEVLDRRGGKWARDRRRGKRSADELEEDGEE